MEKIWSALFFFLAPSLGPSQPEVMGSGVLSLLSWLLWPTKSLAEHSLGTHAAADTALTGEASPGQLCPPAWLSIEPGCSFSPRKMGTPDPICSFPSPEQGPKKQPLFASSISVWLLTQKINYSHSLT